MLGSSASQDSSDAPPVSPGARRGFEEGPEVGVVPGAGALGFRATGGVDMRDTEARRKANHDASMGVVVKDDVLESSSHSASASASASTSTSPTSESGGTRGFPY